MKRIFSIGIMAALLMVFVAVPAFAASTIFNGVTSATGPLPPPWVPDFVPVMWPQIAAAELVDKDNGYDLDIWCPEGGSFPAGIGFKSGANLPIGTTITVNLTNATFAAPDAGWNHFLFVYDPVTGAPLPVSGTPTAGGAFTNYATFTITNPVNLNQLVSMSWGQELVPGIWLVNPAYAIKADPNMNQGGQILVSVDCSIAAASAPATVFQIYQKQLGIYPWKVSGIFGEQGVDFIDVPNFGRKLFVGGFFNANDTGFTITMPLGLLFNQGWDPTATILPGSCNIQKLTVVLSGNFTGIANPVNDVIIPGGVWIKNYSAAAGELTLSTTDQGAINALLAGFLPVIKTVNGTTVLDSRVWSMSGTVEMGNDQCGPGGVSLNAADVALAATQIGSWNVQGKQFMVPFTRYTDDDTCRSFIRLVNREAVPLLVFADVIEENGTMTVVQLDSIGPGQTKQFWASDIKAAAGIATPNWATQLTLASAAANIDRQSAVYANAFFNILSGGVWTTRDITVYEQSMAGPPVTVK